MKPGNQLGPPPSAPWMLLNPDISAGGFLSFYYSETFTRVPIRAVSKPLDNKADPNLETQTYGLFSTCSKGMRKAVVNRRIGTICFVTSFRGEKCITGFYKIKWYCPSGFSPKDYCLAADSIFFSENPMPLSELKSGKSFRGFHGITEEAVQRVCTTLESRGNATETYLKEIDRAERFNLRHTAFRYLNFNTVQPFDWKAGINILNKASSTNLVGSETNTSPTDTWSCVKCGKTCTCKSLLKLCPHCGECASLIPIQNKL